MKAGLGLRCALAVLATGWPRLASAYRPFDGTDGAVAAPHEIELEVGPVGYHREGKDSFLVTPALVLNYGVAPDFELVLEGRDDWALGSPRFRSDVTDVALSLKTLLRRGSLQGRRGLSIAIESGLLLPGSESRWGGHVSSIFSQRFSGLTLHLNLNNNFLTSIRYEAGASLIVEGPETWRVRPVAEALIEREFGGVRLADGLVESLLVGAIAPWGDAFSFDLGLRYGWLERQHDEEARLGFTWAFELR